MYRNMTPSRDMADVLTPGLLAPSAVFTLLIKPLTLILDKGQTKIIKIYIYKFKKKILFFNLMFSTFNLPLNQIGVKDIF